MSSPDTLSPKLKHQRKFQRSYSPRSKPSKVPRGVVGRLESEKVSPGSRRRFQHALEIRVRKGPSPEGRSNPNGSFNKVLFLSFSFKQGAALASSAALEEQKRKVALELEEAKRKVAS